MVMPFEFLKGEEKLVRRKGSTFAVLTNNLECCLKSINVFVSDDGKVIKAINTKSADSYEEVEPLIIEEIVVFPSAVVISSLRIVVSQQRKKLVVVSSSSLVSISLHRCGTKKITTCSECVGLQDPYCGWDKFNRKCRVNVVGKELIQSVVNGIHPNCSKEKPSHSPSVDRDSSKAKNGLGGADLHHPSHDQPELGDDPSAPISKSIPLQFTAETLAIAVASAAIGALILGFITGFFCGKKCNKEEDNQLYAVTDYEYYDQRQNANSRLTGDMQEEVTYAEPVLVPQSLNKPVNLLLNMSPKATLKTPSANAPSQNMPPMGG
ncbi:Semaphorin-1A, partial [Armadillidium nasatum]